MTESADAISTRNVAWGPAAWSALWPVLLFAALAAGMGWAIDRQLIAGQPICEVLCNVVLVAGLYLVVGLAGELSFAQLAFFAMAWVSADSAEALDVVLSGWAFITLLLLLCVGIGIVAGLRAIRKNQLAVVVCAALTAWIFSDLSIGISYAAPWLVWSRALEAMSDGWFWLTFEVVQPLERFVPSAGGSITTMVFALLSIGLLIWVISYVICRLPRYATPIVTLLILVAVIAATNFDSRQMVLTLADAPLVNHPSGVWAYLAAAAVFIAWRLTGGATGSRLRLYQQAPEVAQTIGVSLFNNRMLAFFVGSMFALIAGLVARGSGAMSEPLPPFMMERSLGIVAMVMLIAPGHLWWTLVSTVVLTVAAYFSPLILHQMGPLYGGLIVLAVAVRALLFKHKGNPA